MNADGSKIEMLVGWRVDDGGPGTTIKPKKGNNKIAAFLIDRRAADTRTVLISAQPYSEQDTFTSVERIDLFNGPHAARGRPSRCAARPSTSITRERCASQSAPTATTSGSSSIEPTTMRTGS
jgi:hypothetical protein